MKATDKKYFSVSEVAALTGIPIYKLRYLEKSTQKLTGKATIADKIAVYKIRGRRYYSHDSIRQIKTALAGKTCSSNFANSVKHSVKFPQPTTEITTAKDPDYNILLKIDSLLDKFSKLITPK